VKTSDKRDRCTEATHEFEAASGSFCGPLRACARASDSAVAPAEEGFGALRAEARASNFANVPRNTRACLRRQLRAAELLRVPCGARRRRDGQPCEALSVPGKQRCKWHGGMSTGPRTAEGKARVAAHLPRRRKKESGP
jgi:hypothetical protein